MIWIFGLALIPFWWIVRCICFKSKYAGWYESRYRWDMFLKGLCLVWQHGLCMVYWDIINKSKVDLEYSGLPKYGTVIAAIFAIVCICCFIFICAWTLLYVVIKKEKRKTCLCNGFFHDIVLSDWRKLLFYPVFIFKKTYFVYLFVFFRESHYMFHNQLFFFVMFLPTMYMAFWPPFRY